MDPLLECVEGELLGQGLTTRDSIDRWTDLHADEVGPRLGAQAVARLWDAAPQRPAAASAGASAVLGRCTCGRRWQILRNTPTVHNVVVPTGDTCTGWRVLGTPPSWYNSYLWNRGSTELTASLSRAHDLAVGPDTQIRFWSDTATTHHLVVPLRPGTSMDVGPFELAALVSRPALRGVGSVSTCVRLGGTVRGPDWAHDFPGYGLDERELDHPWELRTVALVLAVLSDNSQLRGEIRDDLERIATALPVRTSIYTAWLWTLARALS